MPHETTPAAPSPEGLAPYEIEGLRVLQAYAADVDAMHRTFGKEQFDLRHERLKAESASREEEINDGERYKPGLAAAPEYDANELGYHLYRTRETALTHLDGLRHQGHPTELVTTALWAISLGSDATRLRGSETVPAFMQTSILSDRQKTVIAGYFNQSWDYRENGASEDKIFALIQDSLGREIAIARHQDPDTAENYAFVLSALAQGLAAHSGGRYYSEDFSRQLARMAEHAAINHGEK